jgi:hypothetical protein
MPLRAPQACSLLVLLTLAPGCSLIYPFSVSPSDATSADTSATVNDARDDAGDRDLDPTQQHDAPQIDAVPLDKSAPPDLVQLPDSSPVTSVKPAWSKAVGSIATEQVTGVVSDSAGNVYITGYISLPTDFGGGTRTPKGSNDLFLASYTPSGKHRWSTLYGGVNGEQGRDLAIDAAGNLYVIGIFSLATNLGGTNLTSRGGNDVFVASFSPTGGHRWSVGFGSTNYDEGFSLAVSPTGKVYTTGTFPYTLFFDSGDKRTSAGYGDIFLATFSTTGSYLWSKRFGGVNSDSGKGVAADALGNIYLAAAFNSTVGFGGQSFSSVSTSPTVPDSAVVSFDANGNHRWSKHLKGPNYVSVQSIAAGVGGVAVCGSFHDSVDYGAGKYTNAKSADAMVIRYSDTGSYLWSKHIGGLSFQVAYDVALDGAGNLYLTGWFDNTINPGSQLVSKGLRDIMVVSYSKGGAHRWSHRIGGTQRDYGYAIAAAPLDAVFVGGTFAGSVTIGSSNHSFKGGTSDGLLVKLVPGP